MKWGQKSKAQKIVHGAFDVLAEKNPGVEPMAIVQRAIDNVPSWI